MLIWARWSRSLIWGTFDLILRIIVWATSMSFFFTEFRILVLSCWLVFSWETLLYIIRYSWLKKSLIGLVFGMFDVFAYFRTKLMFFLSTSSRFYWHNGLGSYLQFYPLNIAYLKFPPPIMNSTEISPLMMNIIKISPQQVTEL